MAAASDPVTPNTIFVNIMTNEDTTYEAVYTGTEYPINGMDFAIYETDVSPEVLTSELEASIAGNAWGSTGHADHTENLSATYDMAEDTWTVAWEIKVHDAVDTDDDSQSGATYRIYHETDYGGTYSDITHTNVEAIPEFPTIALPVAAIIGLAFFMQRRKEE
jgi:hypothetical protein